MADPLAPAHPRAGGDPSGDPASPAPIGPTREDVPRGIRRADQEYVATYGIPESTDDDQAWAEFIAAAILDLRTTREDAPALTVPRGKIPPEWLRQPLSEEDANQMIGSSVAPSVTKEEVDRLVQEILPPVVIFADSAEHLEDLRSRARQRLSALFAQRSESGEAK